MASKSSCWADEDEEMFDLEKEAAEEKEVEGLKKKAANVDEHIKDLKKTAKQEDGDDDVASVDKNEPQEGEPEQTEKGELPFQPIAELTAERIAKRQKQLDLGKATTGYRNYIKAVPKDKRADAQQNARDQQATLGLQSPQVAAVVAQLGLGRRGDCRSGGGSVKPPLKEKRQRQHCFRFGCSLLFDFGIGLWDDDLKEEGVAFCTEEAARGDQYQ